LYAFYLIMSRLAAATQFIWGIRYQSIVGECIGDKALVEIN